ncbi:MAG: cobalamin-dependent protein, partial [Deltaproteobacteria bacterium]|nr:cobalamin-dependent protein [Deltaproteobacteria bacterium]
MKVVLAGSAVTLPHVGPGAARYNLALGCLEAALRHRVPGVEVERREFPVVLDEPRYPDDAAARILASGPDLVGISTYCWDLDAARELIPRLAAEAPGLPIVLGGP